LKHETKGRISDEEESFADLNTFQTDEFLKKT